jgi:hypothetical protein
VTIESDGNRSNCPTCGQETKGHPPLLVDAVQHVIGTYYGLQASWALACLVLDTINGKGYRIERCDQEDSR